jgi:hypothetical protein
MNHIRFHDLPVLYDVDATKFIEKATVLIVLNLQRPLASKNNICITVR